ncbi:MAG: DNA polymerase III subunit alpha [Candidatus Taylorbacteria bacterium RIFCSPHIGHO2_01_FULL_45_63]|uniref:DNA polymerase III subunit alpha n=1 Tax=Candidatus Taylorbacteria bacterium RIFCSPHIGHO2_02_FULL_45_35 TaxID=1802311 RepID=A0A1G2MU86_9BACT|nr:MAG: DNA polymerase III subunit alpha [Candidatus Taylorbacteria bacterium RIFCSPHIGHO2_01_FULL_45_63]OHA27427.1 MAG: DNA polymerase III subunit alpha [Candidatus Taylorbacteria bacterium RIFCSPHIGHO2_02_FULL_45_35]OHA34214.1 MAG: DNA polymerase III subunit alpha [Candidatus Taylorbacteria bacterium RIFCSPLOWO2_01_FULL_45_34b]
MKQKFTHLHTHSHYSLLSALPKIPDLVARAKEEGMATLALTDNGNLYGAIEFYKECKKEGIKPIIGVDTYVAGRTRFDKQAGVDNRRTRLVLLAKNETGYKNLLQIVTLSHLEGFYYKPRVDQELLQKYADGLVAISSSFNSEIVNAIRNKDFEKAEERASWYKNIFSDFFIEITHHPEIEGHQKTMEVVCEWAHKMNIPVLAAHDVHYLDREDKKARDTLLSIQTGAEWNENKNSDGAEDDFSFISAKTALGYFKKMPEALLNTARVADLCALELELGKWNFPEYKTANGRSHDDELKEKTLQGLAKRAMTETAEITARIKYELGVIRDKGYAPYFLVVNDLLEFAHQNHILTTIRGSVAGSLVTYLAGITNVNPIEYKLPFERFLNPERPSAPDIDMDFADNRRDEMIEYAKKKYGSDKVAQIGTFGTMMARGSVRDVARALGYDYNTGDKIAKLIPMGSQGFPMSIDRAMEIVPELKQLYKGDADVKDIIDMAKKIEGCARHISVHAAGVVIAPTALTNFVPLQFDPKGEGKIITQYDMYAVDEAGLLKFDFLGIKNLSILADAVSLVAKLENKVIDIENIPLDDKKTFAMLAKGETIGLFQLNGSGMTRYLKDLRPTTIHDINAMVALYRPGPMESIPEYIKRKHNPKLVTYLDPRMKEILDASYGVIVYQDDVLLISIKLAGYSWLEADKLRKAMGKKIPAEMEAQKEKLRSGLVKNAMSAQKAEGLWKLIEPFAAYGFGKAHAASYGKVAYQTAYMKANFPAIYMSAVLTADSGDVEKIGEIITECKRMNILVLPPNINESFSGFTVVKSESIINNQDTSTKKDEMRDRIRFGLTTIKNFGEGIAVAIIEEREKKGKFKSLEDFLTRIKDRNLNKKSLEALIRCGAMDEFGERGAMLHNIEYLLEFNKETTKSAGNQVSLFGLMAENATIPTLKLAPASPAVAAEKLAWEKELLGLYISGHPLDKYRAVLEKQEVNIKKTKEEYKEGMIVVVGGIIEEAKSIITKKNEQMLFIKLADLTGSIEAVVFPRVFSEFKDLLVAEKCIALKGRISNRNGTISLIAEKIKALT